MTNCATDWLTAAVRKAGRTTLIPINALITLTVRTHKSRWARVAREVPPWDERNRVIASFVPDGTAVLDIGSGARTLKKYLGPGCIYQPCDVVQSAPEVLLCDFNAGLYPKLERRYDYVVCSGVLEYIREMEGFLSRIMTYADKALLSYNPLVEGQGKLYRLNNNWINHLGAMQLEKLFESAGLDARLLHVSPVHERLYELTLK